MVKSVERTPAEVTIRAEGLPPMAFDEVVFACHGDEVIPALAHPTQAEREVFASFTTNLNEATLHTDASILPAKRRAWASWNHLRVTGAEARLVVTYHLNRLQRLETRTDYFVSLNAEGLIGEDKVIKRMSYRHPAFTREAIRAQGRWQEVSGRNRTHYCGAYWGFGFHEDGVRSAVRVAQRMGIEW
jgi:predicted NAD/FAD-binding protein